jgi:hypothetical protein
MTAYASSGRGIDAPCTRTGDTSFPHRSTPPALDALLMTSVVLVIALVLAAQCRSGALRAS